MNEGEYGIGENGERVGIEPFPYGAIDGEDEKNEAVDAAVAAFEKLIRWEWQDGSKNAQGMKLRAIIVCWIFLKEVRVNTLSDMARMFDLDKQSLGRWVDDFKREFPEIRINHMK